MEVDEVSPPGSWLNPIFAALTTAALAGWTAFFVWANQDIATSGLSPQSAIALTSTWAPPVLVIGVLWLIALRTSTREAVRFNDAARQLRQEARQLEQRLSIVNGELSLAREFIAAQSRDLESLGRIAAERISEHANRLDGLIKSNGAQIDAIASVSETALDNMERLRNSLPVIVSSAKDVTNNIGNAGRSAQAQLQELVNGFHKLNEFGQASDRQVQSLRIRIEEAIARYSEQSEAVEKVVTARFAALAEQGEDFRAKLAGHEVEALAAIRSRAAQLSDELAMTRRELDDSESESIVSLRARLSALREETSAIARSLRESEGAALAIWREGVDRLEAEITALTNKADETDRRAMEVTQARLAKLAEDSARFDDDLARRQSRSAEIEAEATRRLRESMDLIDAQIAQRRAEAVSADQQGLDAIRIHLATFDKEIAERHRAHEEHSRRLLTHGEQVALQLTEFAENMQQIATHGEIAGRTVSASLQELSARLGESRTELDATESTIQTLTDNSVRLLELIRASATHAKVDLPLAIAAGEQHLELAEKRAFMLRDLTKEAASQGAALSDHVLLSRNALGEATTDLAALHERITDKTDLQSAKLIEFREVLAELEAGTGALAEQAEGALRRSIDHLATAAQEAVRSLERDGAGAVAAVARQLTEESGAALDKVMRTRAAEAAGQLEQAAAHAAGVSREAAIQLRDQLAKVNELAGNLERRVAHARERAEEQVDNDFARRSALITEALNSNAIDIAKALDSDVSDTAWAAYLKGDRGIFTRRAVRLLDAGQARSILQLYDTDREFRGHVGRYIHDFEAMLRQMLSTRDGHALGVTLLSSDMGKLYVALAQSIERLRD